MTDTLEQGDVRVWHSFSVLGLCLGTLLFAASLTPTLLPRDFLLQGVLSGVSAAVGYGLGVFCVWLWRYLELPEPPRRPRIYGKFAMAALCVAVAIFFLWKAAEWQNSIRALMQLEPVDTAHPFKVGGIALVLFLLFVVMGRGIGRAFTFISGRLKPYVPRRVANVIGIVIVGLVLASLVDRVLLRYALRVADSAYAELDALFEDGIEQPESGLRTGGPGSLIPWDTLGRTGRQFVVGGDSREAIAAFTGREALEPMRVYVGLRSAETADERAELALEELKRIGAFERKVMAVVAPTGTGWIDPEASVTLEYLHGGDTVMVAQQYSYLTSWLSLLIEPSYGAEAAHALFRKVYGHWTTLPKDDRPELYLYGLSLGALSSEQSTEIYNILADPFQGALWAGPPFNSRLWSNFTRDRNPGTPAWLPRLGDGSVVRFTAQKNSLDIPGAKWGPLRIVYLQYASDPVVFFDPLAWYRRPAWLVGERGPDVSPDLRWYPIVTFLQLALDMAMATTAPIGYGHLYAPQHYIDAWVAVTQPEGWSPAEIERLKEKLKK
ncbi:alpha/beta-hydrolase family protein [Nitratireductor aquimarinus]|uniref:Alpha/beta-hydrolase family protein n=1 Tax=Nitratireductor aquimarinus TaxID=889300 RepID=A0ABU4AQG9_9HYPH|nr:MULTISPECIES: alpha/beta-hydrolase family protein [Alphaproteobacteria]MBY6022616.1 alpha/beta-hydrolase family protein [Nitratireductor sp. DP7N14-4]MBN7757825.1 alpha/beta-hydrolase family protein [Nitratireductor aquimarinus]MBN7777988.1 alpha/beta-hydrolase family protein [Nitratireductor pacificus]MBN7782310.1 alpha/beta-hydrolase family protein [Nitratireductor pacificus]MBN7791117.1 alpha/beta-hydrolase family protein [Nitratireductor aquimarinus]